MDCILKLIATTSIKTLFCVYIRIVDGGWSNWLVGNCSKLCDGGNKTKTRTCNNPAPSCGGSNCIGESIETVECNTNPCVGMYTLHTFIYIHYSCTMHVHNYIKCDTVAVAMYICITFRIHM